jgi:hypothetical protein
MIMQIVNPAKLPDWLEYPPEYIWLVEHDVVKWPPWYLLNEQLAQLRWDGLQNRFPSRRLFPFAARLDNDDIACWENGKSGKVIVIHDFASEPFADRREYACFWDWFRVAIADMIEYADG